MDEKTENMAPQEFYRIGELSKYLGVTPDFLKHYETFGLVKPEIASNGYRYYRFNQSNRIFECMKLRNHGFTVKEMNSLLNDKSEAEVLEALEVKSAEIEEQLQFQRELVDEYYRFAEFMRRMGDRRTFWTIESSESALFLPHTNCSNFLNDPRIYELLPYWIKWMPMVRSAVRITGDRPVDPATADWRKGCVWGLKMPERLAMAHSIPVNDVVTRLPAKKMMRFHFAEMEEHIAEPGSAYQALWETLNSLSLTPAGPIYLEILMRTRVGEHQHVNGRYLVPLEE